MTPLQLHPARPHPSLQGKRGPSTLTHQLRPWKQFDNSSQEALGRPTTLSHEASGFDRCFWVLTYFYFINLSDSNSVKKFWWAQKVKIRGLDGHHMSLSQFTCAISYWLHSVEIFLIRMFNFGDFIPLWSRQTWVLIIAVLARWDSGTTFFLCVWWEKDWLLRRVWKINIIQASWQEAKQGGLGTGWTWGRAWAEAGNLKNKAQCPQALLKTPHPKPRIEHAGPWKPFTQWRLLLKFSLLRCWG